MMMKARNKKMEKTYCQKVRYKIVIEGEYSCHNLKEELWENAEEAHDCVLDKLGSDIYGLFRAAKIELTDLRTEED
jgi:hypothetical protein